MTAVDSRCEQRRELGAFLRAFREQLAPAELGIAASRRRRTPGLRREEVAANSGVGLAWYSWLEQGRVSTSREVLEALARTLRMAPVQRRHLLRLGGFHAPEPAAPGDDLRPLLASWPFTPAVLLDQHFDVLAANPAHSLIWPEPTRSRGRANLLVSMVGEAAFRRRQVERERLGYELFLRFRALADQRAGDPEFRRVLDELETRRPDLAHWWRCRDVRDFGTWPVTVLVPGAPRLRFDFSLLTSATNASTVLLVQAPADAATGEWIRSRAAVDLAAGAVGEVSRSG